MAQLKPRIGEMIRDKTGVEWKYLGRQGKGHLIVQYQPRTVQMPVSEADFAAMEFCSTGEMFDRRKHCLAPTKPEKVMDLKEVWNGLISPEGDLYACKNGGHRSLAYRILYYGIFQLSDAAKQERFIQDTDTYACEENLLSRGWIKMWTLDYLAQPETYFCDKDMNCRLNKRQMEVVFDWGQANSKNVTRWIKNDFEESYK